VIKSGRPFYKMSGSGNDFVMVDARDEPPGRLADPTVVQPICARGTGVGADGVVFLERSDRAAIKLTYLNADGSLADLCGNATLCTTRLAVELGAADPSGFTIETGAGVLSARLSGGRPEFDLQPVTEIIASATSIPLVGGETQIGFALAGVPHLVIRVPDVSTVDVVGRGRPLRSHQSLKYGANVNFVSSCPDGTWCMRTYERGVEGETLACGTGSVASAVLLTTWGLATSPVRIRTRSGRELRISLTPHGDGWKPSLSGEAVVVFQGRLAEL
jgi:diaminopimelate epimerase